MCILKVLELCMDHGTEQNVPGALNRQAAASWTSTLVSLLGFLLAFVHWYIKISQISNSKTDLRVCVCV